ncbi:guanine nucleotide-binding protein subunit alpha [Lobulomyces angularis]|nr:guanine nucleotide-binding protein subunit alpha [Lobulomyces angularis]
MKNNKHFAKIKDAGSFPPEESFGEFSSFGGENLDAGNEEGINLTQYSFTNPRKAQKRNDLIEKKLNKEKMELSSTGGIKILVLGSADSGKSTLIKQIRILNAKGFSMQEIDEFHVTIIGNLIESMKKLILGMEILKIKPSAELIDEFNKNLEIVKNYEWDKTINVNPEIAKVMIKLSKMNVLVECWERQAELNGLDIICSRKSTTGITTTTIQSERAQLKFIDVSGQKSQRKIWLPYFEDAAATMFVVDISSYDKNMEEDENTNRLADALALFGSIVNNEFLSKSGFMLFFNKMDLFLKKIKISPIKNYLTDFEGKTG